MNRNTTLIAGLLVLLTIFGVSNLPKGSESGVGEVRKGSTAFAPVAAAKPSEKPLPPCSEIASRLQRLVKGTLQLPASCYEGGHAPGDRKVGSPAPQVRFVVAMVPDPISTHLPLLFDRLVTTTQQ